MVHRLGDSSHTVCGLRLDKAAKGHDRLKVEVQTMQAHVLNLNRPDGNTHEAHRSFRTRLNEIESEVLDILDKYSTAMSEQIFISRYQQLQAQIDLLSNDIEILTPKCSLTSVLPDVSGSVLKASINHRGFSLRL